MSAQDKLKALLAKKRGESGNVPDTTPKPTTKAEPETNEKAVPTNDTEPTPPIAPAGSVAAKLAALRAAKAKAPVKELLDTTATDSSAATETDLVAERIMTSFKATDEMYQIDGFDPDKFMTELSQLNDSLEAKAPNMGEYLYKIHKNLKQYPELTHLLEDEQIAVVTSGLLRQTNTEIAVKATKSKSTKKSAPISIDMAEALF